MELDTTPRLSSSSAICSRLEPLGTTTRTALPAVALERLEQREQEPRHGRPRRATPPRAASEPAPARARSGAGGQVPRSGGLRCRQPVAVVVRGRGRRRRHGRPPSRRSGAPRAPCGRPRAPRASGRPGPAGVRPLTPRAPPRRAPGSSRADARRRASRGRRCPPVRSARRVVRRSSCSSTGTGRRRSSRSANARASAGLRALLARERQRQAHHHALGLVLARPARRSRQGPRGCPGARRREARSPAVPEGSDTAQPQRAAPWSSARTRPIRTALARSRAAPWPSASGSFSGSRPPACAMVSRPPPPPPATFAAARTTSPARSPRSTAAGAKFATRCTRPSTAQPEHHGGVAEPLADGVRELQQRVGVGRRRGLHHDLQRRPAPRRRAASSSGAPRSGALAGAFCSSFTRSLRRSTARTTSGSGTRSSAARSRSCRLRSRKSSAAGAPRHRLDAPHVRSAGGLAQQVEEAELGRVGHVRAAAELARHRPRSRPSGPSRRTSRRTAPSRPAPPPRRAWSRARGRGGSPRSDRRSRPPRRPARPR